MQMKLTAVSLQPSFSEGDAQRSILRVDFDVENLEAGLQLIEHLNQLKLPFPENESVAPQVPEPVVEAPKSSRAVRAPRAVAPTVAPTPKPVVADEPVKVEILGTEFGDVKLWSEGGRHYAQMVDHSVAFTEAEPDKALESAVNDAEARAVANGQAVTPVVEVKKVMSPKVEPKKDAAVEAPKTDANGNVPPALVAATSFRQVMTWMMDNGCTTAEQITKQCERFREHVPAISRLSGDLGERVGRAFEVLAQERQTPARA